MARRSYEGHGWAARARAAHAAFLGIRWLSTDVVEGDGPVHGGVKFYGASVGRPGLRRA